LLFLDITGATAAIALFVGEAVSISFRIETRTLVARISTTNTAEQIMDVIL
jgi:hypothetical protein